MASLNPRNAPMLMQSAAPVIRKTSAKRDLIVLGLLTWSLMMAMTVSQDYVSELSTFRYLTFTVPIVIAALSRPLALSTALGGKAMWLLPFLFLSAAHHSIQGDFTAAFQVGLLVLGLVWFCSPPVRFNREDVYRLYGAFVAIGFFVWIATDFNRWGLIPGTTDPAYGVWRVSFFSNIAFTGFFSLFVILVATKNGWKNTDNKYILALALYFLVFSYVRTAVICLVLYVLCQFIFRKINRPSYLFLVSLLISISANAFIAYSSSLFNFLQDVPVISRLFLRGESQLTEFEIYQQLYRPWLWGEQIKLFLSSPYLMGWGSIPFHELVQNSIFDYRLEVSDTVSLPTKLLSQFGLAAIFFWIFLIVCLKQAADRMDRWGCAVFPVVFTAMMHWGSMFHVTDPMAMLFFGLLVKGSMLVSGPSSPARTALPSSARRHSFVQTGMR
jgi:hypothetical protein